MSIRARAYTIEVGETQDLEQAQGEDCEFRLYFTDASGTARNLTGAQSIIMTVRNRSDSSLIFARSYASFGSGSSGGVVNFQVLQADTADETVQPYNVDVFWTDASGYAEQLLEASTYYILLGVRDSSDPVTTPPAVPVVYGLSWQGEWTGKSGGYNLNDSVYAYDGSLGATAVSTFRAASQGVTYHPVTGSSQVVATGWNYVGQHGGIGPTGGVGATGPRLGFNISSLSTGVAGVTYWQLLKLWTATGVSVPIPLATGHAGEEVIVKVATGLGGVLAWLTPTHSEKIDSATSIALGLSEAARLVSDGSNWMVI